MKNIALMNYMVLEAETTIELMAMVHKAMADGWRVCGGVAVAIKPSSHINPEFLFCQAVTYGGKEEVKKHDPHEELKAQYALDVETCKGIDGLDAWDLWQVKAENGSWSLIRMISGNFYSDREYRRKKHADNIILYHQCSDDDKKRWEFKNHKGEWESMLGDEPSWVDDIEYRLPPKHKTITINGYEVPEPESEPLKNGDRYFLPDIRRPTYHRIAVWEDHKADDYRLERGLVHKTKEAAVIHAKAMLSFTASKGDENANN